MSDGLFVVTMIWCIGLMFTTGIRADLPLSERFTDLLFWPLELGKWVSSQRVHPDKPPDKPESRKEGKSDGL